MNENERIKKAITQLKRRKTEAEKYCTGDFTKGMAEGFRVAIEILSSEILVKISNDTK